MIGHGGPGRRNPDLLTKNITSCLSKACLEAPDPEAKLHEASIPSTTVSPPFFDWKRPWSAPPAAVPLKSLVPAPTVPAKLDVLQTWEGLAAKDQARQMATSKMAQALSINAGC